MCSVQISVLSSLKHKNIMTFYDSWLDPKTHQINFITELKTLPDHDKALTILKQLAAIYKPVMKKFGLQINHLQEYEHNREFAGRNFNAGENVEMVDDQAEGHSMIHSLVDIQEYLDYGG